jgi:hypothetical protein
LGRIDFEDPLAGVADRLLGRHLLRFAEFRHHVRVGREAGGGIVAELLRDLDDREAAFVDQE